jgi:hypothetical protein
VTAAYLGLTGTYYDSMISYLNNTENCKSTLNSKTTPVLENILAAYFWQA